MTAANTLPRREAYGLGAGLTMAVVGFLLWPVSEPLSAPGPLMHGHADSTCADCHRPAGSKRLGFLRRPISNDTCLTCHGDRFDAHPGHRFNAPTFADARKAIAPQSCVSCHREHRGQRVSGIGVGFCGLCHQSLSVARDRIQPTHADLAAAAEWTSCLRCHDYHGNHSKPTPRSLPEEVPVQRILDYFKGGPAPYDEVVTPAKKDSNSRKSSGASP